MRSSLVGSVHLAMLAARYGIPANAVLLNPTSPSLSLSIARDAEAARRALGRQIQILNASTGDEIDAAFATLAKLRAGALLIGGDAFFTSRECPPCHACGTLWDSSKRCAA